jgi:hypothetical protein
VSVVVWWAIPLVATVLAVVWLSWRGRPRPGDPHETVEQRRRFNEAMQVAPLRRRRSRPAPPSEDPAEPDGPKNPFEPTEPAP